MALSDTKLRSLKPQQKPYKVSDADGLYVVVTVTGSRLWRFDYRLADKRKTLSIGKYPDVGLSDARLARDNARSQIASGIDPAREKQHDKIKARISAANSFRSVAEEWLERDEGRLKAHYRETIERRLQNDIYPAIGHLPISSITPIEVLESVRAIERRGSREMARRVMNYISGIFQYGVATLRCDSDVTRDVKKALLPLPKVKHQTKLPEQDIGDLLVKLDQYNGDPIIPYAILFTLLTITRTNEIRFAKWSEFDGLDGDEPIWRIPGDRMKMKRDHIIPLQTQAVGVLRSLRPLRKGDFLFPSVSGRGDVISENTMLYALYRMGYHSKATIHGFRGTASTWLNEQGYSADWIERQLAHVDSNQVRKAYNAAEWMNQRRKMMQEWADFIFSEKQKAQ